jgi:transposase
MKATKYASVGAVTALATEVFLGDPRRFADSKAVASYIGVLPSERSSGQRQRFGKLSKQGNALLRFLWGEAAFSPEWPESRYAGQVLLQEVQA